MKAPSLTLGIEEEYQIVDPDTGELKSFITQILKDGVITVEDIKPELHQSVVEVGSTVCQTPAEIRSEVVRLRSAVIDLAAKDGLEILAAGTHPFSSWMDQEITPLERYQGVEQDLQDLARKNLIFGMHVHVGIEDPEFLMDAIEFWSGCSSHRRRLPPARSSRRPSGSHRPTADRATPSSGPHFRIARWSPCCPCLERRN